MTKPKYYNKYKPKRDAIEPEQVQECIKELSPRAQKVIALMMAAYGDGSTKNSGGVKSQLEMIGVLVRDIDKLMPAFEAKGFIKDV